ncbi:glycosyltransferase family 4 protein [Patescibacteria group bacterium]|nr:glycosyltransferase family 4 protein [Patescibacteria group bacterium]
MKIVHIAKYYLPHLGGVEIHLKEINSLLIKMGHEVTVVTLKHNSKLADSAICNGVKVIRIPDDVEQRWEFIKSHKDTFLEADVIHVHDVFWWIMPIYKLIRKKIFITFHGWETKYPVRFNAKLQRYVYSKLSRGSIHVGAWIQKFYFDKPSYITYGGINAKRLTKSGKKNHIQDDFQISIAFIGRLSNDNEVEKYIQTVGILKTKGYKVNITWIGDGEYRQKCEKLGEVTGFVKNISKYLVNKDLIFSSSYLSILEAQLIGNNVCSFYSNNLKKAYLESFPGSKYLLIANTPESMISKITLLFDSPKSENQSKIEAREFAKQQTWGKALNIYLKLWDEGLAHHSECNRIKI